MNKITSTYKPEFENYEVILKTPYTDFINKIEYTPNNVNIKSPIKSNSEIYYTIIFASGEESLVKSIIEDGKYYFIPNKALKLDTPYVIDTEICNILYPLTANTSNEIISVSDILNNYNLTVGSNNSGTITPDIYNKLLILGDKRKIVDNISLQFTAEQKTPLFIAEYKENQDNIYTLELTIYNSVKLVTEINVINNETVTFKKLSITSSKINTPNLFVNSVIDFIIGVNYVNGNKFGICVVPNFNCPIVNLSVHKQNSINFEYINIDNTEFGNLFNDDKYLLFGDNKFIRLDFLSSDFKLYQLSNSDFVINKTFGFEVLKPLKQNDTFDFNNINNQQYPNVIMYQKFVSGLNIQNKPTQFNTTDFKLFIYQRLFGEDKLTIINNNNKLYVYTRYVYDITEFTGWKLSTNSVAAEDIITSDELQFISKSDKLKIKSLFDSDNLTENKPKIAISGLVFKDGDTNSVIKADGSSIKISDLKSKVIKIPKGSLGNSTSAKYTIEFTDDIKNQFGTLFNVTVYEFIKQQ